MTLNYIKYEINNSICKIVFEDVQYYYVNHLISKLRSINLGCRYGNEYMGVYCYADDISLLSQWRSQVLMLGGAST